MVALASCAVGPDFSKPAVDLPKSFSHQGTQWKRQSPKSLPRAKDWWGLYGERELSQLVELAIAQNATLDAAAARLAGARATSKVARSRYFPNITIGQQARRVKSVFRGPEGGSIYYKSYEVPVEFSYEIDLWGKVRRQVEGAIALEASAEQQLRALQLSVAGEVAQTYWALRALDADRELYARTLEVRREALELIGKQRDAGSISDLDYSRAAAEVASAESDRIQLEAQRVELVNALAVLTGRMATGVSVPQRSSLPRPPRVPVSLPSEVLQQRPDVRAALHQVAAANAEIGVATAAMYPSLTINANGGVEASEWGDLLSSDALVWSLGSNILMPLTSQKLLRHRRDAVRQEHRAVSAEYRQSVIEAVAEVETAIQTAAILQRRLDAQQQAVEAARSTYDKSLKRYKAGLVSFLDVVDAERTRLEAERKANAIRAEALVVSVSLIKAVGGRW
ncbi:MAG: efflux transporter outer membrane subunit [Akkermansiaceae bacterium]|nr:efflux transporter outer membrane subunit [Akkermansiaceae bacterium]